MQIDIACKRIKLVKVKNVTEAKVPLFSDAS